MTIYSEIENVINQIKHTVPSADRRATLEELARYIAGAIEANAEASLMYICTHNSRRSQFAQIWSAVASSYYNWPVVHYSGGVEVTAFNERAVISLRHMGFRISENGDSDNPHYSVKYAEDIAPLAMFSKMYDDQPVAVSSFAAVMVCAHADENCPYIPQAEARIALRYEDPKAYDNTALESAKYDERSLEIASEMFYLFGELLPLYR